jgi:transcriptional regulator with XRE-family HTH domain
MAERQEAGKAGVTIFADLGTRLRHARKLKGLRLTDVTRIVGCSESLLSKIETNKAAPSLHTLHRIAAVLDTTVAALFSDPASSGLTVYSPETRPEILLSPDADDQDGGAGLEPLRLQRLIPHTEGRVLNANIHVVPPGSGIGGALKHEGEEVGYVLEGRVTLTVDGETRLLTPGMSFFFRSSVPHSYRNPGPGDARILWVNAPPY